MQTLMRRIQQRKAVVGIIGMGYVGLPLAHTFRESGFPVLGFDIDPAKVKALMAGLDAVLISTNHSSYDYAWIVQHAPLVIDARNACVAVKEGRDKVVKA